MTVDWEKYSDLIAREFDLSRIQKTMHCLVMIELLKAVGEEMTKLDAQGKISLFHDRTNYDGALQHIFSALINSPEFPHSPRFATMASLSWQDCIPLQPADLFAFEACKQFKRASTGIAPRKSFNLLAQLPHLAWKHQHIGAASLMNMSVRMKAVLQ